MKKYILIMALIAVAFSANAQKLEKPSVDKFSGAVTITTKEEVVSNKLSLLGHKLSAYILKSNQDYILFFHSVEGGGKAYFVSEGDTAYIKFTSGKLIAISLIKLEYAEWREGTNPPVYDCNLPYYLTKDDVGQLLVDKIQIIRIHTSMGNFDYEVNDKKSEVIKKQLELITKQ